MFKKRHVVAAVFAILACLYVSEQVFATRHLSTEHYHLKGSERVPEWVAELEGELLNAKAKLAKLQSTESASPTVGAAAATEMQVSRTQHCLSSVRPDTDVLYR